MRCSSIQCGVARLTPAPRSHQIFPGRTFLLRRTRNAKSTNVTWAPLLLSWSTSTSFNFHLSHTSFWWCRLRFVPLAILRLDIRYIPHLPPPPPTFFIFLFLFQFFYFNAPWLLCYAFLSARFRFLYSLASQWIMYEWHNQRYFQHSHSNIARAWSTELLWKRQQTDNIVRTKNRNARKGLKECARRMRGDAISNALEWIRCLGETWKWDTRRKRRRSNGAQTSQTRAK